MTLPEIPYTPSRNLTVVETAKLVRQVLKADFPGVKFSVRSSSYAGGASIRVGWTDGPTAKQVEQVTNLYRGASFDPMIDLKSVHDSILVGDDGTPEKVHFGADYIFAERDLSDEFRAELLAEISEAVGREIPDPKITGDWHVQVNACTSADEDGIRRAYGMTDESDTEGVSTLIHQLQVTRDRREGVTA